MRYTESSGASASIFTVVPFRSTILSVAEKPYRIHGVYVPVALTVVPLLHSVKEPSASLIYPKYRLPMRRGSAPDILLLEYFNEL